MEEFEEEDSECPDVCFWAIDVADEALGGHVDRRTDVDVFEAFPGWRREYLVNLANPKSAILARLLFINTLATFRSR